MARRDGAAGGGTETSPGRGPATEPGLARWALTACALVLLALFLGLPLAVVVTEALRKGAAAYLAAIRDPDTLAAIRLTLATACVAVPLNVGFGLAAAWAIAKFDFPGKRVLVTLIDLPFTVSPVIAGLAFVLLFGAQGWFAFSPAQA